MNVYLGKERQNITQMMTATLVLVRSQTEGVGHKLYMDSFFSPDTRGISCCGTVRQNHKGMPGVFDSKTQKLKWGDIHARVRCNPTAIIWKCM
jgi:hypothetical protein